jgi:hypothetical protein
MPAASPARSSRRSASMAGDLGELTVWLQAEEGWYGLVRGKGGVRWVRAEDLRRSAPPA